MSDKLRSTTQPSSHRRSDFDRKANRDNLSSSPRQQKPENKAQARNDIRVVRHKQIHGDTRSEENGRAEYFSEQANGQKYDSNSGTENNIWRSRCCTHATTDVAQVDIFRAGQEVKKSPVDTGYDIQHKMRGRVQKAGKKSTSRQRKDMERCAQRFSSELKAKATPAEKHFLLLLDKLGIRYDFQMPVRKKDHFFVVDFYLKDYATIIEIDGEYHCSLDQQVKDSSRTTEILQKTKFARVLRYTNGEVFSFDSNRLAKDLASKLCPWAF